jgi:hypothetical protein
VATDKRWFSAVLRERLEDEGVKGRIILKRALKKVGGCGQDSFSSFVVSCGGLALENSVMKKQII